jgi:DNA-binding XRE family transcriptional regulator
MPSVRARQRLLRPPSAGAPARPANSLRTYREDQLLTKAELARKAGISALTLTRIERGEECRVDTKRKILLALGLSPGDKDRVFGAALRGRAPAPAASTPMAVAARRVSRPRR